MCRIVATSGGTSGTTTSHTITLPSGIVNGSRVTVRFASFNGSHTHTIPAGWSTVSGMTGTFSSGNARFVEIYRDCDGSEGASITIGTSISTVGVFSCFRFTGHAATAPIGVYTDHGDFQDPDPAALITGFGSVFTHWHVGLCHRVDTVNPAEYPTGFDNEYDDSAGETREDNSAIGTLGIGLASAEFAATASALDPDEFGFPSNFCGTFLSAMESDEAAPDPPEELPDDPPGHTTPIVIADMADVLGVDGTSAIETTALRGGSIRGGNLNPKIFWVATAGSGHRRTTVDASLEPEFAEGSRVEKSPQTGAGGHSDVPTWPVWTRWSRLRGSAARLRRWRWTFSCGVRGFQPSGSPGNYGPLSIGIRNHPLTLDFGLTVQGVELWVQGGASRNWAVRRRRYNAQNMDSYATGETDFSSDEPHRVRFVYTEGATPTIDIYIDNTLVKRYSGEKEMPVLPASLSAGNFGPAADGKIYTWDARILIEEITPSL